MLTVLGAALILLHYWHLIATQPLLYGVIRCMIGFCGYIVVGATLALLLRRLVRMPSYVFRKVLHLIAFSSLVAMQLAAEQWYIASLTALIFAAVVYPVLCVFEGRPWFDQLFVQKGTGEIKRACFCCS